MKASLFLSIIGLAAAQPGEFGRWEDVDVEAVTRCTDTAFAVTGCDAGDLTCLCRPNKRAAMAVEAFPCLEEIPNATGAVSDLMSHVCDAVNHAQRYVDKRPPTNSTTIFCVVNAMQNAGCKVGELLCACDPENQAAMAKDVSSCAMSQGLTSHDLVTIQSLTDNICAVVLATKLVADMTANIDDGDSVFVPSYNKTFSNSTQLRDFANSSSIVPSFSNATLNATFTNTTFTHSTFLRHFVHSHSNTTFTPTPTNAALLPSNTTTVHIDADLPNQDDIITDAADLPKSTTTVIIIPTKFIFISRHTTATAKPIGPVAAGASTPAVCQIAIFAAMLVVL
ncbi:hypothetical protein NLG97_g3350 [Lecanicillium saksenae]|uniref:Uncharacterized protein n=1 Tax=Lecanicillium saksenae TaxID=468837 RepID=A0ACC1QYF0_9HYPO|nr:hypothetical protein NLG97_g3350 [Lecanicillium saksenae]